MNHINKFLIAFCLSISGISIHAQNAIPAAGGNASGTGGSISYTVGQIVYSTVSGSNGTITQGVQQPFEISVVTGTEAVDITLSCSVYPNPTIDFLTLRIEKYETKNLYYWLYDMRGNLLENKKVEGIETRIGMQNFSSGTFFVKVTSGNKEIKTFKVIKN
jgi:hypothetical protein